MCRILFLVLKLVFYKFYRICRLYRIQIGKNSLRSVSTDDFPFWRLRSIKQIAYEVVQKIPRICSFTPACVDPKNPYWVLHWLSDLYYLISLWFTFLFRLNRNWTHWHWSALFSTPDRVSMPAAVVQAVHLARLLALEISLLNFP